MVLSEDQISELMLCGRFNFPASKCIIKLGLSRNDAPQFLAEFNDRFSATRQTYEKGKIATEFEIMEALETKVATGGEYADEAAKALNSLKRYQHMNELLNEMFDQ